jgi:hypothetical protein
MAQAARNAWPQSVYSRLFGGSVDCTKRGCATASLGGVSGNGAVGGHNSNGEPQVTAAPPSISSTLKATLGDVQTGVSSSRHPLPALQLAAREGRSAVDLVSRTPVLSIGGFSDNPSLRRESDHHLQDLRDGFGRHRQSLKLAAESLLKATKATSLLADSISEIRSPRKPSTTDHSREISILSLHDLHKAFMSVTQSLLDCLDPHPLASSVSISTARQRPLSMTAPPVPSDDKLVELLLIVAYRSHQLSLPFHWPLYQRMAVTLARQPHISTLRSRAEWIWNIHQWSQSTWGEKGSPSFDPHDEQRERKHRDMIDWFRPSVLTLAEGQFWSDLNYLLRQLLQSPFTRPRNHSKQNKLHSKSTPSGTPSSDVSLSGGHYVLDKGLTRSLLLALERHGVLPDLWNNILHPSPVEEDALEILLLLEASILRIFECTPNSPAPTKSIHAGGQGSKTSPSFPAEEIPGFVLREAVEAILRDDPTHTLDDDGEDSDSGDDSDYDSFAKSLQDLDDMLRDDEELQDDEDPQGKYVSDVVSLAALLRDPFWQAKGGQQRPLNGTTRIPRDLDVRVTRSGPYHILELTGLGSDGVSSTAHGKKAAERASWTDDESSSVSDERDVYRRNASYHDAIPDITHQLYEHNGNLEVRYSSSLVEEIYEEFHPSSRHFDGDD